LDNNILKKHAFTVISEFLSHNSIFIIECFKKILEQKWMEEFEKINLFQDNEPHFKNCYMMNYFSLEIPVDITLNFFGEYHGKSDADTFFSLLSRLKTTFEQVENITSTSQLIGKYQKYFETHGQSKEKSQENIYTFIELNDISVPTHRAALKIPNIKLYYHFQFQNKKIKGGVTQENIENMTFSISLEEFNGVTKKSINVFKVIEKRLKLSSQFKGRIKRQKLFMENISEKKITKQKEKKEKKPKKEKRKREETFLNVLELNEKPMKIQLQKSLPEDLQSVRRRNKEKRFMNVVNENETVLFIDDELNEKRKNEKRTREKSF
jgi:glycogen debranching enzyme